MCVYQGTRSTQGVIMRKRRERNKWEDGNKVDEWEFGSCFRQELPYLFTLVTTVK